MDISKGLFRNVDPVNQPPGTFPYGKNGILNDKLKAVQNEPGFTIGATCPGTQVGIIETDAFPVFLSLTAGGKLQFYTLDPKALTFTLILDTTTLPDSPIFTVDNYWTGEFERNYKGNLVIAVTNKKSRPLYLNVDEANLVTSFKDLYLIPLLSIPNGTTTLETGGVLDKGQYIPFVSYEKKDGTRTHFVLAGTGIVISKNAQGQLRIDLTNVDTRYDMLTLGIMKRSLGKVTCVKLQPTPITSNVMTVRYSGSEVTTTLLEEELLQVPPDYATVASLGQLAGELFGLNFTEDDPVNLQAMAMAIRVEFTSSLIDMTNIPTDHKTGATRSLLHQEVYALYIRGWTYSGRPTRWFHIPGNIPQAQDLFTVTVDDVTEKSFRLNDTIPSYNVGSLTGKTGVWQNDNETYPDTADFDGTPYGGPNLRNQKVLHHRMPSLKWLKEKFYPTNGTYGMTSLDILGLKISNVQITDPRIQFWEIGFAQRSQGSSTILGYAPLFYGGRLKTDSTNYDAINVYSTAGNWTSGSWPGLIPQMDQVQLNQKTFRLHPFEALFFKPLSTIWALQTQWKLRRNVTEIEDGKYLGAQLPEVLLIDYTDSTTLTPQRQNMSVAENFYLNNNRVYGRYNNSHCETALAGKLTSLGPTLNYGASGLYEGNQFATPPAFEETLMTSILQLRSDVYLSFFLQQVIPCADKFPVTSSIAQLQRGDAFCCLYTFHTQSDYYPGSPQSPENLGRRVIRRVCLPSSANINARYVDSSNIYSQFWPVNAIIGSDPNNYIDAFLDSQDPNQFGYDRDFSAVFDLDTGYVFNPYAQQVITHPYRVHRFGKMGDTKLRSWHNILALDYYELQRDKGVGVNIDGDEVLIIHMENGLLMTRSKAQLSTGPLSVVIGTGDIFAFEPKEGISSKLGYAGTQHDLGCYRCPVGYLFCDARTGEVFVLKGEPKNISAGLSNFFRDFLKPTGKNTFQGNGITMGYDQYFKRLMLTVKNKQFTNMQNYLANFLEDQAHYNLLVPNQTVVFRNGKYMIYRGVNNPVTSGVPNIPVPLPTITGIWLNFLVLEGQSNGAVVTNVSTHFQNNSGTGNLVYSIASGNIGNAWAINAATGILTVNDSTQLVFATHPFWNLTIRATDPCGGFVDSVMRINLQQVGGGGGGIIPPLFTIGFDTIYTYDPGTNQTFFTIVLSIISPSGVTLDSDVSLSSVDLNSDLYGTEHFNAFTVWLRAGETSGTPVPLVTHAGHVNTAHLSNPGPPSPLYAVGSDGQTYQIRFN